MIEKELLNQQKSLEKIVKKLEKNNYSEPKGRLRVVKHGKTAHYFHVLPGQNKLGQYIRKENLVLARELAEKDYLKSVLKEAKKEHRLIGRFLKTYKHDKLGDIYSKLNLYRKNLLEPIEMNDEEFVQKWEKKEFLGNPFAPEERIYKTRRGEMVRSKSEVLIANTYYSFGIPYRYEAPLVLANGVTKYPDFIALKMPERICIVHEHMGLMDHEDYRRSNFKKLKDYADSGYYIGYNLLLSFETAEFPFDEVAIKEQLKLFFDK